MSDAATELLELKFDQRFDLFDVDGDGLLDAADFTGTAARFIEAFGVPADSRKAREVAAAYAGLWNTLVRDADTDRDGKVDRTEFKNYLTSNEFRRDGGYEATFGKIAESVLAMADTDGDGTISFEEFAKLPGVAQLPAEQQRSEFDRLDQDGSKTLDIGEVHAAQKNFYLSTEPDAAGNALFGKIR